MSQSIGQKLAAARKRRDLTIEDVAHETRIHVDTLRNLEADDYSRFANFTYARSFLSMYGRHLGIEMTDYIKEFRSENNGGFEIQDSHESSNGSASSEVFIDVRAFQSFRPVVAIVTLFAIVCTIPAMYFIGKKHGFESANKIAAESSRAAAQSQPDFEPSPPPDAALPGFAPTAPEPLAPPSETVTEAPVPEPPRGLADLRAPLEPASPGPTGPLAPEEPVEIRRPAILIEEPPPAEPAEPEVRSAEPLE